VVNNNYRHHQRNNKLKILDEFVRFQFVECKARYNMAIHVFNNRTLQTIMIIISIYHSINIQSCIMRLYLLQKPRSPLISNQRV